MSKLFRFRVAVGILTASGAIGLSFSADAARVRGTLGELEVAVTGKLLGFTRTRVAPAAKDGASRRRDTALFLAVKNGESFPIPAPTEHQIITIDGLRFSPNIATCASDAQVSFVNADREPVTISVDGAALGTVAPGAQKTYVCSPGKVTRTVRIVEWPHMRALVYVGEVGVADVPNDRGRFSIEAPRGSYELQVIDRDGVVATREVQIEKRDVDVGKIELAAPGNGSNDE